MVREKINYILSALLILSVCMIVLQNFNVITGNMTEGTIESEVKINMHLAIDFSDDLESGIKFEEVNEMPIYNVKAINNTNEPTKGSGYFVSVSEDGNSPVDFCIKGSDMETVDGDVLGAGNESYAYNIATDELTPSLDSEVNFTKDYAKTGQNVQTGSSNYYRFWLDVPPATPSGIYNNSISFKAIVAGNNC